MQKLEKSRIGFIAAAALSKLAGVNVAPRLSAQQTSPVTTSTTMRRVGIIAVLALVVVASGACQAPPPGGTKSSGTASSGTTPPQLDVSRPSSTSGCPSAECSTILAEVAAGATTDSVPPDLSPSLKDASKDLLRPPGGDCSPLPIERLKSTEDPCTFATGAPTESPKIVLIGDSQAWMWSVPVFTVAKELGYGFGLAYQASCHMPAVEFPSAEGGVTDAQCRAWRKAAIDWVNHQNPAVVLVVSGGHLVKNISDAEYAAGYAETLKQMQGPGRKLFVIGAVPLINQDPPRCLAAHSSSALSCATPTSVAVKENLHSDLDAAQQTGAGYVNLLPWLCTADVCPSIIGKYLAYQNQAHMTTTYAEHLIPVLKLALGLSPV